MIVKKRNKLSLRIFMISLLLLATFYSSVFVLLLYQNLFAVLISASLFFAFFFILAKYPLHEYTYINVSEVFRVHSKTFVSFGGAGFEEFGDELIVADEGIVWKELLIDWREVKKVELNNNCIVVKTSLSFPNFVIPFKSDVYEFLVKKWGRRNLNPGLRPPKTEG